MRWGSECAILAQFRPSSSFPGHPDAGQDLGVLQKRFGLTMIRPVGRWWPEWCGTAAGHVVVGLYASARGRIGVGMAQ